MLMVVLALYGATPNTTPKLPPGPIKQIKPPDIDLVISERLKALGVTLDGGLKAVQQGDLSPLVELLRTGDGGTPFAKYQWRVPNLLYTIDVPVIQVIDGLPVRFSVAVTSAKPDFLLKYYVDEFEKAGLYIPPAEHQVTMAPPAIQLSALDTDNLISYTLLLQIVDDKSTTVIMGQAYLTQWLRKKPVTGDFAPLHPTAVSVVRTHTEDMDMVQYTAKAEPAELDTFYSDVMTKAGYTRKERAYLKGNERIEVTVGKTPGGQTGVLLQRRVMAMPPSGGTP